MQQRCYWVKLKAEERAKEETIMKPYGGKDEVVGYAVVERVCDPADLYFV